MRIIRRGLARVLTVAAPFALTILAAGYYAPAARAFDLSQLLGHEDNDPTLETFSIIHVADLKAMMNDTKSPVHIYDANGASTRAEYGVIPAATLLSSDNKYDLAVLPQDKKAKLVFYCANTL
ncbi:MAG TPA: hypothetical protein VKS22_13705 [Candidatus Binataceae bacterium]|nr:hypothetical protein [Candidatus Binataceae bacterium]